MGLSIFLGAAATGSPTSVCLASESVDTLRTVEPAPLDSSLVELVRVFRDEKFILHYDGGITYKGYLKLTDTGLRLVRGNMNRPKYSDIDWKEVESLALLSQREGVNTGAVKASALLALLGLLLSIVILFPGGD